MTTYDPSNFWPDRGLSHADWRRLYLCEFQPPAVIRITRDRFDDLRKAGRHRTGLRIRRSHCGTYWLIDDAIVEFITPEGPPDDPR